MVTLYLKPSTTITKAAQRAILGNHWSKVRKTFVFRTKDIPKKADFVLFGGTSQPEVKLEWWAATKGGCVLCLPEAEDYLSSLVECALDTGSNLVLLDSSLRKLRA